MKYRGWWDPPWPLSWVCLLQRSLICGNIALLSATLTFMCLFLPSHYKCGYGSWCCIFQITIERKSSLTPSAKGTDGHRFWKVSARLFSLWCYKSTASKEKPWCLFLVPVVSRLLLSVCWRRQRA